MSTFTETQTAAITHTINEGLIGPANGDAAIERTARNLIGDADYDNLLQMRRAIMVATDKAAARAAFNAARQAVAERIAATITDPYA